jgi:uncharacterized protein
MMFELFGNWLAIEVFSLSGKWAEMVEFFVADTTKILLLLLIITHFMGFVRAYLPIAKVQSFLNSRRWFGADHLIASGFGAITPFCSCSSLPLFIGFVQARIRLGVTLSFLITSPLVNEVALAVFWATFGWKITLVYLLAGLFIGVVGGMILGKFVPEAWIEKVFRDLPEQHHGWNKPTFAVAWEKAHTEAVKIFKSMALWVIVGVGIGAVMHGWLPKNFFSEKLNVQRWWTVPLAVIVAVPLYLNASAAVPVAESLVSKGMPIGTAMAMMMATVGLSFPQAMILRRIMRPKLLATFFTTVTIGIILIGWGFNMWL